MTIQKTTAVERFFFNRKHFNIQKSENITKQKISDHVTVTLSRTLLKTLKEKNACSQLSTNWWIKINVDGWEYNLTILIGAVTNTLLNGAKFKHIKDGNAYD